MFKAPCSGWQLNWHGKVWLEVSPYFTIELFAFRASPNPHNMPLPHLPPSLFPRADWIYCFWVPEVYEILANTTSWMVNAQLWDLYSAWSLFYCILCRNTSKHTHMRLCNVLISSLSKDTWLRLKATIHSLYSYIVCFTCAFAPFDLTTGQRGDFILYKLPFLHWKSHLIIDSHSRL